MVARRYPEIFTEAFILDTTLEFEDRRRMVALLKLVNPSYFQRVQNQFSDFTDLDDVGGFIDGERETVDMDEYLYGPILDEK
jgi:hypothetical protein